MNTIPLHLLPDEAYLSVLENMEICVQLAYSLCSKNTKKEIKSLNLKADLIRLNVENYIHIEINFANSIQFASYIRQDNNFPITARKEIRVQGRPFENRVQWSWNFKNLEFNEWVHHFCEVLHYPRIDELVFSGRSIDDNDIELVQKVINGLQIGSLVLCVQNLTSLCIGEAGEINIDQILLTTSERIQLNRSNLNEKDLNRLLKLWIRGTNPRLKYFYTAGQPLLGSNSFDKNIVLKGFGYSHVSLDSEEVYRDNYSENCYNEIKLAGGSRIWKFNGTTAVILGTRRLFEFIVE